MLLKTENSLCIPQDPAPRRLIFIYIYFWEKGRSIFQIYKDLYDVFNQEMSVCLSTFPSVYQLYIVTSHNI